MALQGQSVDIQGTTNPGATPLQSGSFGPVGKTVGLQNANGGNQNATTNRIQGHGTKNVGLTSALSAKKFGAGLMGKRAKTIAPTLTTVNGRKSK